MNKSNKKMEAISEMKLSVSQFSFIKYWSFLFPRTTSCRLCFLIIHHYLADRGV